MTLFDEPNPADERDAGDDDAPAVVQAAERLADRVGRLVPVSEDAGNRVLVDNARLVRWAAPLFAACAVVLLPWIVIAGLTLPQRALSPNYDVAWAGYDVILLVGLVVHRGHHAAPVPPAADRRVGDRGAADRRCLVRRADHPRRLGPGRGDRDVGAGRTATGRDLLLAGLAQPGGGRAAAGAADPAPCGRPIRVGLEEDQRCRTPGHGTHRLRTLGRPVFSSTEDSHSGLVRTLGKRVGCKPSGVRIPYPPPESEPSRIVVTDVR